MFSAFFFNPRPREKRCGWKLLERVLVLKCGRGDEIRLGKGKKRAGIPEWRGGGEESIKI